MRCSVPRLASVFGLLLMAACSPAVDVPDEPGSGGSNATGSGGRGTGGGPGSGGSGAGTGGGTPGTGGSGAGGARTGTGGSMTGTGGRGTGGAGGATGSGGTTGAGGAADGGSGSCTITAQSSLSTAIPTVGIVTWSTTLASVTSAQIQFGLADGTGTMMVAPVDLTEPMYRTLLLGMKGSRAYSYKIVATAGTASCTSQSYMITSGAVASGVPKPTVAIMNAAAHAHGFIVTSTGLMGTMAYILDSDGDPVWWATAPTSPSRARMSWDGKDMYMLSLNVMNSGGNVSRIGMDGNNRENNLSGLTTSHHDFTPTPDNGIATMLWNTTGMDAHCSVVERSRSGTMKTVVADLTTMYNSSTFHSNAIHYYASDDSYTISDRNPNLFVKITRQGQLVWQFGGTNPKDTTKFFMPSGGTWMVNHGHQLLPNGNFLFFNNGAMTGGTSMAREYKLDTATKTATSVWTYQASGANSPVLGDVIRLPNGNTLVTFSQGGQIHEVDSTGKLVMSLKTTGFGYTEFRDSLYGPPQ